MDKSIQDLTIRELVEKTASSDPMPGGGAVAAVTGSLGMALVVMAMGVTLKRQESVELSSLLGQGQELLKKLEECADQDIAAYQGYVDARAISKDDPAREQAMQQALITSTEVPLRTARLIKEALNVAKQAESLVTGSIAADVKTGQDLLRTSLEATLHNVDVNCEYIKDEDLKKRYFVERDELTKI